MQFFKHYGHGFVADVPPQTQAAPVIPQPLLIPAGVYSLNGLAYDMSAPGLYRLGTFASAGHRIVYDLANPHAMAVACAGIVVHGTADEGLSDANRVNLARSGWLRMRCGHVDNFVRARLSQINAQSRSVSVLTMQEPTGADDGHVMTEVKVAGNWRLYDTSNDRAFKSPYGEYLQARNIAEHVASGEYTTDPLVISHTKYDPAPTANSIYMSLMLEGYGVDHWTQRIFQAVGIWHVDSKCYFKLPPGSEHRAAWVLSLSPSYRVITNPAEWDAMFYGI